MTSDQRAKRPVVPLLAGPYGHPFHPILVTVPIGAWVASLVFDIASRIVDDGRSLAQGSVWLIAIGILGALVAATVGFLDLVAIPGDTPAFRTGLLHAGLNLVVTAAYVGSFLWRRGDYDETITVPAGQILLAAASLALLAASGFLGGKLAFQYGVRVADETTQAAGFTEAGQAAPDRPTHH